jgi:hypothetical protein
MKEKKKGTPQKERIVPIGRLRKKNGRPAKAVIAELPDGRQVLLLKPLTGMGLFLLMITVRQV